MAVLDLSVLMPLERQGWELVTRAQRGDFYGRLIRDDAVMFVVNDRVLDRGTIAGSPNDSSPWDSDELTEAQDFALSDARLALSKQTAITH